MNRGWQIFWRNKKAELLDAINSLAIRWILVYVVAVLVFGVAVYLLVPQLISYVIGIAIIVLLVELVYWAWVNIRDIGRK